MLGTIGVKYLIFGQINMWKCGYSISIKNYKAYQ